MISNDLVEIIDRFDDKNSDSHIFTYGLFSILPEIMIPTDECISEGLKRSGHRSNCPLDPGEVA